LCSCAKDLSRQRQLSKKPELFFRILPLLLSKGEDLSQKAPHSRQNNGSAKSIRGWEGVMRRLICPESLAKLNAIHQLRTGIAGSPAGDYDVQREDRGGRREVIRMRKVTCLAWIICFLAANWISWPEAYGQSATRQRGLTPVTSDTKRSTPLGPYYALVIGNNDYLKLNKLETAVNDATAIGRLLQSRYGFQTKLLKNATRNDILTALSEYRKTLPENANLLIYYAGHGFNDKDAAKAYWLPVNAEIDNNENWISADDITTDVHAMPALHVLVISDSCYSGDLSRGAFGINLGSNAAFLEKMLKSRSRTLLASGGDQPVADGGAGGHSIFAGALIQNLNQIQDAQFTGDSLFQKIQQQVGGLSRTSQVPHYETIRDIGHETLDDGDFVFSRNSGTAGSAGGAAEPRDDGPQPEAATRDNAFTDADAINEVVQRYQDAFNHLDADALWQIWPNPPKDPRINIPRAFGLAASIQMSIQAGPPEVAADQQNAMVKGQFKEIFTPKNGKPQTGKGPITFVLKKNNGKWVIVDVK
jgi:uncharacterized caspase-like protein